MACYFCNLVIAPAEPKAKQGKREFHLACLQKHLRRAKQGGHKPTPPPREEDYEVVQFRFPIFD